jgi:hypothetical protein
MFSDGVGCISTSLMERASKFFDMNKVSAFQIRFKGAKGVLSWNKDLKGDKIILRESQLKYKSDHKDLEIIRCSSYSPGYLNK